MTAPKYSVAKLADIANIPDEALPRFYAELPKMIGSIKLIRQASPAIAQEMKKRAPWPLKYLPARIFEKSLLMTGEHRLSWIDDDKGTVTVSMAAQAGKDPFYSRTKKLDGEV